MTFVSLADYRVHPAILDAAIHVMVHPILTGNFHPELYHLPSRVSSVRLLRLGPLPETVYGYATLVKWPPGKSWRLIYHLCGTMLINPEITRCDHV